MSEIHKSGFFLPNIIELQYLNSLKEILSNNGVEFVLKQANLTGIIDNPPKDNFNRDTDFYDLSLISLAIEEIYGVRGGRGIVYRAGRDVFVRSLKNFGIYNVLPGFCSDAIQESRKLSIGLNAFSMVLDEISDQVTSYEEDKDYYSLRIHRCPYCWGREDENDPVCSFARGMIQESLAWISGGNEVKLIENKCIAVGDNYCEFRVSKTSIE